MGIQFMNIDSRFEFVETDESNMNFIEDIVYRLKYIHPLGKFFHKTNTEAGMFDNDVMLPFIYLVSEEKLKELRGEVELTYSLIHIGELASVRYIDKFKFSDGTPKYSLNISFDQLLGNENHKTIFASLLLVILYIHLLHSIKNPKIFPDKFWYLNQFILDYKIRYEINNFINISNKDNIEFSKELNYIFYYSKLLNNNPFVDFEMFSGYHSELYIEFIQDIDFRNGLSFISDEDRLEDIQARLSGLFLDRKNDVSTKKFQNILMSIKEVYNEN